MQVIVAIRVFQMEEDKSHQWETAKIRIMATLLPDRWNFFERRAPKTLDSAVENDPVNISSEIIYSLYKMQHLKSVYVCCIDKPPAGCSAGKVVAMFVVALVVGAGLTYGGMYVYEEYLTNTNNDNNEGCITQLTFNNIFRNCILFLRAL